MARLLALAFAATLSLGCSGSPPPVVARPGPDVSVVPTPDAGSTDAEDAGAQPNTPDAGAPHPLDGLPECAGTIADAFTRELIQPPAKDSNGYGVPSEQELEALAASISALMDGMPDAARTKATGARYSVCRGRGEDSEIALWAPTTKDGQAVFAWRNDAARPVIVEVPHPVYDQATLPEGLLMFERWGARVLIASGTHRCANLTASSCSGTSGACGTAGERYRESDMAHTELSAYHVAHRAFSERFSTDWVFGVHGMADAGISISDGTSLETDADAPSARVTRALAAAFTGVTSCNAFPGADVDKQLCGSTDVQGRHLNGSAQACSTAATTTSRRFIHLEQSREIRNRAVEVVEAIAPVLP